MNNLPMKRMGLGCLLLAAGLSSTLAATSSAFVEQVAQGVINEVESGKLALEKGANAQVKAFATQMVADHGKANQELLALAGKLDIQVPGDASLTAKAKKRVLVMRDESFDKAYVDN